MKPSRDKRRESRPTSARRPTPAARRCSAPEPRPSTGTNRSQTAPLRRRDGALPAERLPLILEVAPNADYALIDSGDGEKLEQYGPYRIVRPEGQAIWQKALPAREWDKADAVFTGDTDEEGMGRWRFPKTPLGETWPMRHDGIDYLGRFTSFRHVGVFPEQASHWDHMAGLIEGARRPVKVLNLFGYTGLASLVAARAGAEVTHVDASKKAIGWARENQEIGRPRRQADPLDLRGRDEIRRARGAPRQPLRHHPVRPAGLWPRAEGRGLAAVRGPAGAGRHLPRDPVAEAARRGAHRLFDPRLVLRDPCADARHASPAWAARSNPASSSSARKSAGRALSTSLFSRWVAA